MADKKISALTAASTPLAGTEVLPIVQSSATVKVSAADVTAGRVVGMKAVSLDSAGSSLPAGGGMVRLSNGFTYVSGSSTGSGIIISNGDGTATVRAISPGGSTGAIEIETGAGALAGTFTAAGNYAPANGKGIDFSANTNAAGMTSEVLTWYEEGTWTPTIAGQITAGTGTYTTQVGRYTRIGRVVYVSLNLAWSAHTGTGDMQVNGLPFTVNSSVTSQMSNGTYDLALTALNMLLARAQTSGTFIKLLQSPVGGGAWNGVPMDTSVTVLEITGFYTV